MEIKFFHTNIEKALDKFDKKTTARIMYTIDILQEFGPRLGMPHSKKIDYKLFELRVQAIRIFYTFYYDKIVILHMFVKKTQKIPKKEIDLAKKKLRRLYNI